MVRFICFDDEFFGYIDNIQIKSDDLFKGFIN